jgi:hypothetical protein
MRFLDVLKQVFFPVECFVASILTSPGVASVQAGIVYPFVGFLVDRE